MPKQIPTRVAAWFDREAVSQALQPPKKSVKPVAQEAGGKKHHSISRLSQLTIVGEDELDYDQGLGLYCYEGKPFRGVAIQRYRNGKLRDLSHYVRGDAHGISVVWYQNGQIKLFNEVAQGVRNGLYMEWAEDGAVVVEEHYKNGRKVSAVPKKSKRNK